MKRLLKWAAMGFAAFMLLIAQAATTVAPTTAGSTEPYDGIPPLDFDPGRVAVDGELILLEGKAEGGWSITQEA